MKTRNHLQSGLVFVLPAVMVTLVGMVRQADGALIASWDFHEGTGTSAAANEGGIGDAVFGSFGSGSQPTWVPGSPVPGTSDYSAIHFNSPSSNYSNGGYAAVTTDDVFSFGVEGNFSVAAWLKMPKPTGTTGLVNTLGSSITGWGLVAFSTGNVQLEVAPGSGATTGKLAYNAVSLMNNTEWFHLAATYEGGNTSGNSTAALTLYLNGQQVAANTVDFGGDYSSAAFPDNDLHFGAYANLTRGLQGSLDGVRIYDHVLSGSEVAALVPDKYTWTGGTGDWHVNGNWDPSGVPGSGEVAAIGTGGAVTISDTRPVGYVTVADGASVRLQDNIVVTGEALSLAGGGGSGNPGVLRNLNSDNEWAGPVTLHAGQTNYIGSDSGTLTLSGPITFLGSQAAGFFVANGSGNITVSGDITGGTAGGESVATSYGFSGTLTLSGTNTYAGHTRINAGTLSVAGGSAIPDTSRVWLFGDGKLNLQANETIGSLHSDATTTQVTLNAHTLTIGGDSTDREFRGAISGTGGVTKIGAGIQTLRGSGIVYQGDTAVAGGRLVFDEATNFGNNQPGPTAMTLSNDSTLEFKVGAGNHQNVGVAGQVTIGGNGSLVKSGDGTLILSGDNTYTGPTTVAAGVLRIQSNTALGSPDGGTTVANNATLQMQGGIKVIGESLSLTGGGVASTGALRNLSGDNEWAGPITMHAGQTNRIGVDSGTLTLSGPIAFSGTQGAGFLVVHGGGHLIVSGNITGGTPNGESVATSGGLSGMLTLSGANSYAGHTRINAGTLSVAGGSAIPDASRVRFFGSGTLNLQADETIGSLDSTSTNSRVTLNANTLTVGGDNSNQSFAGVISGTGGLTKIGAGIQTLTNANTYFGATRIEDDGMLRLTGAGAIGNSQLIHISDTAATFDVSAKTGGFTLGAAQALKGIGTVDVGGNTLTLEGTLEPGNSIGALTIGGDLTLGSASQSNFEVVGWDLGQYDLVQGSGLYPDETVTFDGLLSVAFDSAVRPGSAMIFDFDHYAGDFAAFTYTGLGGWMTASFDAPTGVLRVVPEPGTLMLALVGLVWVLGWRRRG